MGSLIFVVSINLGLGFVVLVNDRKNRTNRYFFYFMLSTAAWGLSNYFADSNQEHLFWTKLTYVSSVALAYLLLTFSIYFPSRQKQSRVLQYFSVAPIAISAMTYFGNNIVSGYTLYDQGINVETGPLFWTLTLFYLLVFVAVITVLVRKYSKSDKILRHQLKYFVFGIVISIIWGVLFNLIIPTISGSYYPSKFGPHGLIIFAGLAAYALLKEHLLDVRVIAVEFLVGFLSIILFSYIFFSNSSIDIFARSLIFVIVVIFGYLIVKNVSREIMDKQRLAELGADLEKANRHLQQLDKTKSEFLSIASHQLRTPISGIKGYLSMIIEGDFGKIEDKPKQIIQQVYDNTERLNGLVNDFLDVSRIERGKLVMEREMTDFSEMVQSIVSNFQPVVAAKGLALTYTAPQTPLPKVNVDANKLRQVVLNLVDNAIKYTPKGNVAVQLENLGDHLRCSIKDTGVGLDPEQAKNLFKPFVRATDASKTNASGSGLGLYVARKIIEYHGGKVWAESKGKDLGSTFLIEMPYDQSQVAEPEPEPYLE